jgi:nicotinamidase-related amidase
MIVDVQAAFEIPPEIIEGIRRYSARFDTRIFTRFVNPPGSLFRRKLKQRSCWPGSEDLELLIAPQRRDILIDKLGYGLRERDVRRLKRAGISNVTVCGVDTDACVMGVMFSLWDGGITPFLKEKYCWSSSGRHRAAMGIIREQFPLPR